MNLVENYMKEKLEQENDKRWVNFVRPPSFWQVVRDVWQGEGDLCRKITQSMEGLDAAGATGVLAKKEGKDKPVE